MIIQRHYTTVQKFGTGMKKRNMLCLLLTKVAFILSTVKKKAFLKLHCVTLLVYSQLKTLSSFKNMCSLIYSIFTSFK